MLYPNLSVNSQGHLAISGYDTVALAEEFGTSLMLMDERVIRERCRVYKNALAAHFPAGSMPLYASKALSFKRMYEIMREEGLGVDIVSSGELYTAVKAGFPMEKAYFHGNNKTDSDISFAMEHGIGYFVCDNAEELGVIDAEAARRGINQKLLLRLTPGIDPHTHEKINTGRIDSKFGAAIETGQAESLVRLTLSKKNVTLCGYHCHIGSQIFEHAPFCDAAVLMLKFAADMKEKTGYSIGILNLGGGMAVPYTERDERIDYEKNIRHIGELIAETCRELNLDIPAVMMEPGRSIVADSCTTIYTVGGTKEISGFKNYASIDGGMTDNPRFALYQSNYTVLLANRMNDKADFICTIAGRCCESGDLIQENVTIPKPVRGDLLAVLTTGAYNYSMASNYNRVARPAIVMLGESGPYLAVRRETLDDLIACDL